MKDMLSLALERNLGFAYHDYHEISFGLFVGGSTTLPSVNAVNQTLYDVLVKALVGPDADTRLLTPDKAPDGPGVHG